MGRDQARIQVDGPVAARAIIPGIPYEQEATETALLGFDKSLLGEGSGAYPMLDKFLRRGLPLDGADIQAIGERSPKGLIEAVEGSIPGYPGPCQDQQSQNIRRPHLASR